MLSCFPTRAAILGLAAIGLASIAAIAHSQSFGPPTPGICFLSRERVLDQSKAGAAANARLAMFSRANEQELAGERAAIAADANVLQIQQPVINEAVYQQRAGALALRAQSFETLEATRTDQIARTRAAATARRKGGEHFTGAMGANSLPAVKRAPLKSETLAFVAAPGRGWPRL